MKISPANRSARAATRLSRFAFWAFSALLFAAAAVQVRAQGADVDPPGRVARLSEANGQVWLYSADANEWLGVARNRPLTSGDRLATDGDARAEISLGTTTVRLDGASELEVVQLDDARFIVHLHKGTASARLRSAQAAAEFELDTDEGRFRIQAPGRYRFDRLEQASDLTVLQGQATFEGRNSALPITSGQHGQFWLDASGAAQYTMLQPPRDGFSAWNDDRDRADDRVATARYVSPEMTGAADLDRYGRWEQTPEYGAIWTPTAVASGWAPYSTGHWAWVRPWGWTWVDDAPWGFAPFHYGRWVYHRNVWGWAPGTYVARPVYAPALVAWMGGPRASVSVSIGGGGPPVGWFPLAPREVYVPSYRHSANYVRNVNITHVTNVTNITTIVNNRNGEADRRDFANRRFPNAVTVVPASVLTGRQPVGPSAAQYRNHPDIRTLVAQPRSGPALIAAPVAAPAAVVRGDARPAPRPPIEGRPPGFAGRGDGGRPGDGRAGDGRAGDGRQGDGRPGDFRQGDGRQGDGRPGDRRGQPSAGGTTPGAPPRVEPPSTATPAANAIAPQPRPPAPIAPPMAAPPAPLASPPAVAPPVVTRPSSLSPDPSAVGRPPRGGVGREPGATPETLAPPQRVVPPSPMQRAEDSGARPGPSGRDLRNGHVSNGEGRPQRPAMVAPRAEPVAPARIAEPARAVEAPRPAPPARPPEAARVAPPQPVQRAPDARAAEPSRPPEVRPSRSEPRAEPRAERREERREGREERRELNDKQR